MRAARNTGYAFSVVDTFLRETYICRAFSSEIEFSHTPCRNSKYNAGQEGWSGPPKSRDVRKTKNTKFKMCKHGADLRCDGGNKIIHHQ